MSKIILALETSSKICGVSIIEGENAVSVVRAMCGATDPCQADPGTIRGDFALSLDANIIHSSDSVDSAVREIKNFF